MIHLTCGICIVMSFESFSMLVASYVIPISQHRQCVLVFGYGWEYCPVQDSSFFLLLRIICRSLSILIVIPFYSTTAEHNQFALALAFSMDEVNRNPGLLSNTSLVFDFQEGGCKTVSHLNSLLHVYEEYHGILPNYSCQKEPMCIIVLSGPDWATSAMLGTLLNFYASLQVRICVAGLQEILISLLQFLDAKKIVRRILASYFC